MKTHVGEVDDLVGVWINTRAEPRGLAQVTITAGLAGQRWGLCAQPTTQGMAWADTSFVPHVAPHGQTGFHAQTQGDGVSIELVANLKLGVLVILSCTSYCDGSGRAGHMVREFFRRAQARPFEPALAELPVDLAPVDLAPFEGAWQHTAEQPGFVRWLEVRKHAGGWQMQTVLGDGRDVGMTTLGTYCDNMGYLAFKGQYELDGGTCVLAANTQQELIVLTTFHRFGAGIDDRNRAYRELFARVPEPGHDG